MDRAVIIALFGALTLATSWLIGIYFMRLQKSLSSFFVADKGVGVFVLGMAMAATGSSGWTYIGGPGLGFAFGMSYGFTSVLPMILLVPGSILTWVLQARKFRIMADTHGVLSLPDIARARYNSRVVGVLSGVAVIFGCIAYMSAQIASLGYIMSVIFRIDFFWGCFLGLLVVGSYTMAGGIAAALYADVFQGALMALASVTVAIIAVVMVSPGDMYAGLKATNPQMGHPQGLWTNLFMIGYFLSVNIGVLSWPQLTSRFLMIRNMSTLRWGLLVQNLATFGFTPLMYSVPFAYLALRGAGDPGAPALARGDQVMPQFMLSYMPGAVSGLILAGVLSAILSTASGFINVGSAALVRDIIQQGFGVSLGRNELTWARAGSLLVIVFAWWLAATAPEFVVLLGVAASGIWASTLVPVVTLGIVWRGASKEGAITALLFGLIGASVLQMGNVYGWWALPSGMQAGGITAPLSIALMIVVSKATRGRDKVPADMEMVMRIPIFTHPPRRVAVPAGGADDEPTTREG